MLYFSTPILTTAMAPNDPNASFTTTAISDESTAKAKLRETERVLADTRQICALMAAITGCEVIIQKFDFGREIKVIVKISGRVLEASICNEEVFAANAMEAFAKKARAYFGVEKVTGSNIPHPCPTCGGHRVEPWGKLWICRNRILPARECGTVFDAG